MQPASAPICKQLEEMNEEELSKERTRIWSICKSDTGFWVRVDDAPFRYFGCHQWEDALYEAEGYLTKYGIKVKTYIFY